jgi:hypothetical protein
MLILKAYINSEEIDELHIWNTGKCTNSENNIWEYKILKPEGFEDWSIYHNRDSGYLPLLAQAIEIIMKDGGN